MNPVNPRDLAKHHCVPCEGGVDPLTPNEFKPYLEIVKEWNVIDDNHAIQREFTFKNFMKAIEFINNISNVAESEGHHPDLNLHDWNKLTITLSTHAIGGLSVNDFVMASKIDRLPR